VRARKMDVPIIRFPNGTTRALNQVTIRARVKGFLKEVHFTEGSNVKKDQLLLVIEEEPFKVKVAQAKAVLEEADAALKKARESRAKEVAKARVSLDDAQLQLDRVEERRERNLVARKAASQEDYDQAKVKVDKSTAQVEADTAALLQTTADYGIDILSAQAKIDQARADLDAAQIDLSYCRMYAPIDGRIGELQVKLGNLVGPATSMADTTSLVSIQQLDPMGVDVRPASRFLPVITKMTSPTKIRARLFSTLSHSITRTYDYFPLDIARTQLYTEAQSIEGVAPTMRNIEDPRQERLFDPFQGLFPPLARRILDNGWQGTFRLVILESLPVAKLSEHFHPSLGTPTKELYSMAGLVFLADFHGWTSQQAIEAYMFHTDVQFALNVEPGVQVCTRTVERYQELFLEDDLAALTFKNVTETL